MRRRATGLRWVTLALGALLATAPAGGADDKAPPPFRLAVVAPLSGPLAAAGEETLLGARHAASAAAPGKAVEVLPFDDRDDPAGAEKAYAAAVAAKAGGIIAGGSGRTVDALAAKARKGKIPVLFVGSAGPSPALTWKDPVLFLGSWPVDQALRLADALVAPCGTRSPALVVEDTPRGRELAAALVRNIGHGRTVTAVAHVPPGQAPAAADLTAWREKHVTRLVVLGEPDLLDATLAACDALGWDVPLLGCEGTLSRAAPKAAGSKPGRVHWLVGTPTLTLDGPPRPLYDAHDRASKGEPLPLWPRTIHAFAAADMLLTASTESPPKEAKGPKVSKDVAVLEALRDRRYGEGEARTPVFDFGGRGGLWRFRLWSGGAKGPEPVESSLLPAEGFGPLLGLRRPEMYKAEPGTKVVWVTFGDKESKPPRTIEEELGHLGLGTRGYEGELDSKIRDELMARTLGKLHRLFLRNEDGTPIPGHSWAISFTAEKPAGLKPQDVWTMVVAGDDPDAGGRAWPGDGRCEVYATFLRRTLFQVGALEPKLSFEDRTYLEASRVWKGERLEHLRPDKLRALVDGYGGSFALTGAHELGHIAGCGHDVSDPRSIMNVEEGAGLRETQVWFVPPHQAILDRALGRVKEPPAKKER